MKVELKYLYPNHVNELHFSEGNLFIITNIKTIYAT